MNEPLMQLIVLASSTYFTVLFLGTLY